MWREETRFGSVLYNTVARAPPGHWCLFENTEIRAPTCSTSWPEIPPHPRRERVDGRPRRLFGVPWARSSNIDFDTCRRVFGLHCPRDRVSFLVIRLPKRSVARFSNTARTDSVCRYTMAVGREVVRWLAVEGCIRGLVPLGAGKSTLVRRLQRRDDVVMVRGILCRRYDREHCVTPYRRSYPLLEATERSSLAIRRRWTNYPTSRGTVDLLGMYCRPRGVGMVLHTDGHAETRRSRFMFQI